MKSFVLRILILKIIKECKITPVSKNLPTLLITKTESVGGFTPKTTKEEPLTNSKHHKSQNDTK